MLQIELKLIKNRMFGLKNVKIFAIIMDVITFPENLKTTSGLSVLLHSVISLPDATSCDKINSTW